MRYINLLDTPGFCPLCRSKVHGTLGDHLEAKEAVGFESEQGLEIFEYVRAQKPGGSSGYRSGGKLLTKYSLMKAFDGKWKLIFAYPEKPGATEFGTKEETDTLSTGSTPTPTPSRQIQQVLIEPSLSFEIPEINMEPTTPNQVSQVAEEPVAASTTLHIASQPHPANHTSACQGPSPPELYSDMAVDPERESIEHVEDICDNDFGSNIIDLGDTHPYSQESTSHPEAELIQPHPLDLFGLAFNSDIGVLICTLCQVGLPPMEWRGHLETKHNEVFDLLRKKFKNDIHQLPELISSLGLGDPDVVRGRQAGQAPVRGIKIERGFYCPIEAGGSPCHEVVGTLNSFATHLSRAHKDANWKPSVEERRTYTCDYQTIFQGVHRRYFRVFAGLSPGSASEAYKALIHHSKQPILHPEQADDLESREMSSLLKVTHWDAFVGPFRNNPAEVIDLIAFPSYGATGDQLLHAIHPISVAWASKIKKIWASSSPSMRRLLATADDAYWQWVESDGAENNYTRTLTRFVAGCIRTHQHPGASCQLPLTTEQQNLTQELCQRINRAQRPQDVTDDLVEGLQSLFFACVTRRSPDAEDKQFQCPVQCFIAAYSYNPDDTFKPPSSMTSLLANWQFLLRATAMYQACLVSRQETCTMLSWLKSHCPDHLEDETVSVFDDVQQLQQFVSTLAYNQIIACKRSLMRHPKR
ncbi:hypothetical protein BJ322DRAFT_1112646 [Thelephora terrestris]|uniref:Uncharacterized protein n=1 Tax=Thelephora terrestris TaxID=56493 RepID=A0A9P6H724_9AGAM|nr:hypothetical protein BJ322DRAFT_1112646 [Thelephora terrestris]